MAETVARIAGNVKVDYCEVPQDEHLAENQKQQLHCVDNGIFKGVPVTAEQKKLSAIARDIYAFSSKTVEKALINKISAKARMPKAEVKNTGRKVSDLKAALNNIKQYM